MGSVPQRHSASSTMALATLLMPLFFAANVLADECHLTPVIHVLQYPGCIPKPIPSFACQGRCTSYVQVSGSKIWQTERSCMCCQESGERTAVVSLDCPNSPGGKIREMVTRAPADCMCRPCTALEDDNVMPSEIADY